ncbi:MAG TPA: ricin-type beta-trefoil lectin domain protein [Patescibacteria group bacterium]|nr:ricin-type beta-trefoil lectin domain protein [Patescibacteria group bacterium]
MMEKPESDPQDKQKDGKTESPAETSGSDNKSGNSFMSFIHRNSLLVIFVVAFAVIGGIIALVATRAATTSQQFVSSVGSKCLDVSGNQRKDGARVQLWTCNGTTAQKWEARADGTIHVNSEDKWCLDVKGAGIEKSTITQLWTCNKTAAQVWKLNNTQHTVVYQKNKDLCLDDRYSTADDGTLVWIFTCNGTKAQQWVPTSDNSIPTPTPTPPAPTPTPPAPTPTPPTSNPTPTPTPGANSGTYNKAVLESKTADGATRAPVAFWNMNNNNNNGTETDLTGNNHTGTYKNGSPNGTTLPNGDKVVSFNGTNQYMTVPSSDKLSIPTTRHFTWEAWVKPSTRPFPRESIDNDDSLQRYVDWMGKCQNYNPTCEWEARIYDDGQNSTQHRCQRLSAYVFNTNAGYGSGADWQPVCGILQVNQWVHVVGEYQTVSNPAGCSAGKTAGGIAIWVNGIKWNQSRHLQTGCMSQYGTNPTASSSPFNVGTVAFDNYFPGGIGKIALYDYELPESQVRAHYTAMTGGGFQGSCSDTCNLK